MSRARHARPPWWRRLAARLWPRPLPGTILITDEDARRYRALLAKAEKAKREGDRERVRALLDEMERMSSRWQVV